MPEKYESSTQAMTAFIFQIYKLQIRRNMIANQNSLVTYSLKASKMAMKLLKASREKEDR